VYFRARHLSRYFVKQTTYFSYSYIYNLLLSSRSPKPGCETQHASLVHSTAFHSRVPSPEPRAPSPKRQSQSQLCLQKTTTSKPIESSLFYSILMHAVNPLHSMPNKNSYKRRKVVKYTISISFHRLQSKRTSQLKIRCDLTTSPRSPPSASTTHSQLPPHSAP
jgi:hypothetical protein